MLKRATDKAYRKLCDLLSILIEVLLMDRRIALEDAQISHGRKSRKQRFDGYKRHVLKDLDIGVAFGRGTNPCQSATGQRYR